MSKKIPKDSIKALGKSMPDTPPKLSENKIIETPNEATHKGNIILGSVTIPCAVLKDGTRVLSETGIANALGGRSGASRRLKTAAAEIGDHIPIFLASKRLTSYIEELKHGPLKLIKYFSGGVEMTGYRAEALPEICNVWLQARQDGILSPLQNDRAQAAEIIMRSLAKLGIIALIDEATGYQEIRTADALRILLNKYLKKEFAAWSKRFPDEFYQEIFRLREWNWNNMSVSRPSAVGTYTNDIVYSRLAPGILDELQRVNPAKQDGRRARRHHQYLTNNIGHPALAQHLHAVIGLMRASTTWEQFKMLLDRSFPKKGTQFLLELGDNSNN